MESPVSLSGVTLIPIRAFNRVASSYQSMAGTSDGGYLAIGDPLNSTGTNVSAAGAVGIFKRSTAGNSYSQVQFFQASDREARFGYFGSALAINSNGNYLVVGAYGANRGTLLTDTGSVYMYKKTVGSDFWNVLYQFRPSDSAAFDSFGFSLAMTPDSQYLVASSPFKDVGAVNEAGQIYIYKKSPTTDFWNYLQQVNMINPVNIAQCGYSVKISYDGTYIFAGTEGTNGGISNDRMTVVFKKDLFTDYWSEVTRICAISSIAGMGQTFSISSNAEYFLQNTAPAVSQNSTFMFKKNTNTDIWTLFQTIGAPDRITATDVSSDGSNILLGMAILNSSAGSVYLYKKRTTTDYWDFNNTLVPALSEPGGNFGSRVTFIADNSIALCAAPGQSSISGTIATDVGFVWPFTFSQSKDIPDSAQYVVTAPPLSGRLTLTLPLASNASNTTFYFKTISGLEFAETVTFRSQGSDTIDNTTSIASVTNATSYQFLNNSITKWYTLASYGQ